MATKVKSAALVGVDAVGVDVEAQIIGSLKRFAIVGLPDGVLREARDRVRCAIENSGFGFPSSEVVVSLAPAALPKRGSGFDLAIALGVLAAAGVIDPTCFRKRLILGELALDGRVKPVHGELAAACYARKKGGLEMLVAQDNAVQAAMIEGVRVIGVRSLLEAVSFLNQRIELPVTPQQSFMLDNKKNAQGFEDVVGQFAAKRALEISAAGGHNLLMVGPPGAGKTMLAKRLLSILPPLNREEALEITKVHSALRVDSGEGLMNSSVSGAEHVSGLVTQRPFRSPHHTTSAAGLIGGGSIPVPGEVSLAHRGVLFLDEFSELRRDVIECLREPMETKQVVISRAKLRVAFPANFMLLAAMNPCPCGKRGLAGNPKGVCSCLPGAVQRYLSRISGPILDRIDLQIWVPPVPVADLGGISGDDPTPAMSERVIKARVTQKQRFNSGCKLNSEMGSLEIKRFCNLEESGMKLLENAANKLDLSARGYTRVLKVARTIADLAQAEKIVNEHLAEALSYRQRIELLV